MAAIGVLEADIKFALHYLQFRALSKHLINIDILYEIYITDNNQCKFFVQNNGRLLKMYGEESYNLKY